MSQTNWRSYEAKNFAKFERWHSRRDDIRHPTRVRSYLGIGLDDEVVLFFNPEYPASVQAAKHSHNRIASRKTDKNIPMTEEQWTKLLKIRDFQEDTHGTYKKMQQTQIPIVALLGENDISFATEDWFAAKGQFPTVQMIYFPQTGHGPQHQLPELSAGYITEFLKTAPVIKSRKMGLL